MPTNMLLNVLLNIGLLGIIVHFLSSIITPFFLGALLAYLGNPVVTFLKKRSIPRTISVFLIFFLVIIILMMLVMLVAPLMQQQILLFVQKIPEIFLHVQTQLIPRADQHLHTHFADYLNPMALKKELGQYAGKISNSAGTVFKTLTHSTLALIDFAMNIILVPVVAFYLMRDWPKIMQNIQNILPPAWRANAMAVASECDEVIGAFFKGQLLVMLALGMIYSTGLRFIGLELAVFIGLASGLLAIVPYLGFTVGIMVASAAMYFQTHTVMQIVYVWVVYAIGQMAESMLLTPWLVGDRIGLHPVAVIFAVLSGGVLFGFLGVLLALPVAAVLLVIVKKMVQHAARS